MAWKEFLKHFLPVTFYKLDCENKKNLDEVHNVTSTMLQLYEELHEELQEIKGQITDVREQYERQLQLIRKDNLALKLELDNRITKNAEQTQLYIEKRFDESDKNNIVFNQSFAEVEKRLSDQIENNYKLIKVGKENLDMIKRRQLNIGRTADEAVWAQVFNNTVADSNWLVDRAFSPGRWALGYPAMYLLYRVLSEFHPQSIMELGLGQSTKMITQYVQTNPQVSHYVVESNPEWIEFYQQDESLPNSTSLIQLNTETIPFRESSAVRAYKGFQKQFSNMKFDLIIIDAPFGGDMEEYSRIDVLSILPNCLKPSFVIIFDDAQRHPESSTVQIIRDILSENDIPYKEGTYRGTKDTKIITNVENGFLCSM